MNALLSSSKLVSLLRAPVSIRIRISDGVNQSGYDF